MAEKTFKWDASVLTPSKQDIEINGETITLIEFPRTVTEQFIIESIEKKLSKEEKYKDDDGVEQTRNVRIPMKDVLSQQSELVNRYLSKATKGVKTPKFFETAEFTANAYGHLVELLFELNHIEDILAVGGNWLVVPNIYAAREAAALAENATS